LGVVAKSSSVGHSLHHCWPCGDWEIINIKLNSKIVLKLKKVYGGICRLLWVRGLIVFKSQFCAFSYGDDSHKSFGLTLYNACFEEKLVLLLPNIDFQTLPWEDMASEPHLD
jgi:hypothetical protein